jgi:dTDP-L-rhamnose 4-epimerase
MPDTQRQLNAPKAADQDQLQVEGRATHRPAFGTVLITGGAGFVGSHLADELIAAGYRVRLLDNLDPQVHGGEMPAYLHPEAELIIGNVLEPGVLERALAGVRYVVHLAAAVGVGQSMYEIARYNSINSQGTAELLQAVLTMRKAGRLQLDRLVVASSMSVYGEGLYRCPHCGPADTPPRDLQQLKRKQWDPLCPSCSSPLEPRPTPEDKRPNLQSIYALSKYQQEEMVLIFGRAYDIPSVALRFFNIYGPRQALSNPYTGVCAIFAARLLQRERPQVFEDGRQQRDFVSVHDVARGIRLALERDEAAGRVFNIASGRPIAISAIGQLLAKAMELDLEPELTGRYRFGDIRHCIADISRACDLLGYEPRVSLADGMAELVEWLRAQSSPRRPPARDTARAQSELLAYGLTG